MIDSNNIGLWFENVEWISLNKVIKSELEREVEAWSGTYLYHEFLSARLPNYLLHEKTS